MRTFPNYTAARIGAKRRNHYRAAIRQFLQWTVRKDNLSPKALE